MTVREPIRLRPAAAGDVDGMLALLDHVIAWLAERGRSGQWGSSPVSADPAMRGRVEMLVDAGAVTVAERDGALVGVLALSPEPPPYVPLDGVPPDFLYVLQVTGRRDEAGRGAGRALMDHAEARARAGGHPAVALDHWAGAPELSEYYAGLGYREVGRFSLPRDGAPWDGVVRVKPLPG